MSLFQNFLSKTCLQNNGTTSTSTFPDQEAVRKQAQFRAYQQQHSQMNSAGPSSKQEVNSLGNSSRKLAKVKELSNQQLVPENKGGRRKVYKAVAQTQMTTSTSSSNRQARPEHVSSAYHNNSIPIDPSAKVYTATIVTHGESLEC